MAQENLSSKILPSNNIEPTIHPFYPTNKVTYIDQSVESVQPCKIYPESSDISNGAPIEFVIHECSEFYIVLSLLSTTINHIIPWFIVDRLQQGLDVDGHNVRAVHHDVL